MSQSLVDFKALNHALLLQVRSLIVDICPGGKFEGAEYKAGSIHGGPGDSFSFNIQTGKWADFAVESHKGGDIISLYAAIRGVKQLPAALSLAEKIGFEVFGALQKQAPNFRDRKYGDPSKVWTYTDRRGNIKGYVVRYNYINEHGDKAKKISQMSIDDQGRMVYKAMPDPRPLYKLEEIVKNPKASILICEGEKAADAAQLLIGPSYITTTSIGGSNAPTKTNWSELTGKNVLIWPDNDAAGRQYAAKVLSILSPIAASLRVIRVHNDPMLPEGFDAADAVEMGWTHDIFKQWGKTYVMNVREDSRDVTNSDSDPIPYSREHVEPVIEMMSMEGIDAFHTAKLLPVWTKLGLQMNKSGAQPNANAYNAYKILTMSDYFGGKFSLDTFKKRRFFGEDHFSECMIDEILIDIQGIYGIGALSRSAVETALSRVFRESASNSFVKYVESLEWDGVERIGDFFIEYYGAKDTQYTRDVSKNFWVGMVSRGTNPSAKLDNMVIIEGPQGLRKSTSLEIIGGPYYGVVTEDPKSKDFYILLGGKLLVEVAELDAFGKAENTTLKRMLSTSTDNYRGLYEREHADHPRTCTFMGTTNRDDYLSDRTGARRYWPIKATNIKIDKLREDRDQLFAEAYHYAKLDTPYWHVDPTHLEEIYGKRMSLHRDDTPESDLWYNLVYQYSIGRRVFDVTSFLIAPHQNNSINGRNIPGGLGLEVGKISSKDRIRVCNILKSLGYRNQPERIDGRVEKVWRTGPPHENEHDS